MKRFGPERVWFVLATSSMAAHTRVLLAREHGAVPDGRIVTFDGLVRRVIGRGARIVGAASLAPLVRSLAAPLPSGHPLAPLAATPGFAAAILSRIGAWSDLGIGPESLRRHASGPRAETTRALADFYENILREIADRGVMLRRDAENAAAARWCESTGDRPAAVVFDGFYDLTPGQRLVFEALLAPRETFAAFTLPGGRRDRERFCFAKVRRMGAMLEKHGFVETELEPAEDGRPPFLRHIGETVFRDDAGAAPPPDDSLAILVSDNAEIESEWIARRIRRMISEGTAPEKIGVVCRTLERHGPLLRDALAREGVPCVLHGHDAAPSDPVAHHVREMIDWAAHEEASFDPDGRRRLLDLLRDLAPGSSRASVDRLEIADKDRWSSRVADYAEAFAADAPIAALLRDLAAVRRAARAAKNPGELRSAVQGFLRIAAERHIPPDPEMDRDIRKRAAAALAALHGAVHRFFEFVPAVPWSPAETLTELSADLAAVTIPAASRQARAVHVVDALEARSWTWDDAFIVGMTQGAFPMAPAVDGF
ncbi:MAG: hypothetical protein M5R36_27435 [Deltaproteobacteria bacterium]|nr:hypothetical protein [Deltaproteobacteria bacterium]